MDLAAQHVGSGANQRNDVETMHPANLGIQAAEFYPIDSARAYGNGHATRESAINAMKTLLYIEEKQHVLENFLRLMNGVGFFNVLTAKNVSQAIDLADQARVDIIIVGRQIAAADVATISQYQRNHPDIKLISMVERKSKVASLLKAFEYHIQFEMPADLNLLLETLLSELELNCGGRLRGISLPSFLQMIELEGKSCSVEVLEAGKTGHLYIQNGDLIDAELGELNGKRAAFAILEMENPLICVDYCAANKERAITQPLMSILLESGRKKDEKDPKPKENRRHKRFACALPVVFFLNEKPVKGLISNISLGGIFLKTNVTLAIGDTIQVALYSPSLDKSCKMPGVVVRTTEEGYGIEFQAESMKQMGILRTVIIESRASVEVESA